MSIRNSLSKVSSPISFLCLFLSLGCLHHFAGRAVAQESKLAEMIRKFDTNGDGKLDPQERLAGFRNRDLQQKPKEQPVAPNQGADNAADTPIQRLTRTQILARYDKDNSGKLEAPERAQLKQDREEEAAEEAEREIRRQFGRLQQGWNRPGRNGSAQLGNLLDRLQNNNAGQLEQNGGGFGVANNQVGAGFGNLPGIVPGGLQAHVLEKFADELKELPIDIMSLNLSLLEKFDTDHSGLLTGQEKAAAIQAVRHVIRDLREQFEELQELQRERSGADEEEPSANDDNQQE